MYQITHSFFTLLLHSSLAWRVNVCVPIFSASSSASLWPESWFKLQPWKFVLCRSWCGEMWRLGCQAFIFQERLCLLDVCPEQTLLSFMPRKPHLCLSLCWMLLSHRYSSKSLLWLKSSGSLFFSSDSDKFWEFDHSLKVVQKILESVDAIRQMFDSSHAFQLSQNLWDCRLDVGD